MIEILKPPNLTTAQGTVCICVCVCVYDYMGVIQKVLVRVFNVESLG